MLRMDFSELLADLVGLHGHVLSTAPRKGVAGVLAHRDPWIRLVVVLLPGSF